jgi:hypothetical protein
VTLERDVVAARPEPSSISRSGAWTAHDERPRWEDSGSAPARVRGGGREKVSLTWRDGLCRADQRPGEREER